MDNDYLAMRFDDGQTDALSGERSRFHIRRTDCPGPRSWMLYKDGYEMGYAAATKSMELEPACV